MVGPTKEVAPGIHRLGNRTVNFYVIDDGGRITVVDAGCPGHFDQLTALLDVSGRSLEDVEAILLTHAHADHTGFAERARAEGRVQVHIHHADAAIAQGGDDGRSNEIGMWRYLWRPATYRTIFDLARAGGTKIVPVERVATFQDGETLDVPGTPRVVHTPGHTRGHAVLHVVDRDVVLSGDALVTYNPLTGRRGPQIMPAAFNESSQQALASLERVSRLSADVVLPGHGDPFAAGSEAAVSHAREAGRS